MKLSKIVSASVFILLFAVSAFAANSTSEQFPINKVKGKGPLPYNYRIIDGHLHAGGHPLNPHDFVNSDEQVLAILQGLKSRGVTTVIDLENTIYIQDRYRALLKKAGLKRLHVPMNAHLTPSQAEWQRIKDTIEKTPVYVHCKWGADRTGSIIAKYLIDEKGYGTVEAWEAVISDGSHAGPFGGLKRTYDYRGLIMFICPDAKNYKEFKSYFIQ